MDISAYSSEFNIHLGGLGNFFVGIRGVANCYSPASAASTGACGSLTALCPADLMKAWPRLVANGNQNPIEENWHGSGR
jgi:hypothetical protein